MLACAAADDENLRHLARSDSMTAVAENVRPPVAVRIVRPYKNEDEFLENELETVGKTSVILIGAHPRPTGVILRFEVTLQSGGTILRGEGRVLSHKENAFRGQAGLSLRFTRLDPKSKALVDRAAALREARIGGGESVKPSRPPPPAVSTAPVLVEERSDPALAAALAATPVPPPIAPQGSEAVTSVGETKVASVPPRPRTPPPPPAVIDSKPMPITVQATATGVSRPQKASTKKLELTPPPPPVPPAPPSAPRSAPPPPPVLPVAVAPMAPHAVAAVSADREAVLARLRSRAAALTPARIEEIMGLRRT
jgi:hypothetical protein